MPAPRASLSQGRFKKKISSLILTFFFIIEVKYSHYGKFGKLRTQSKKSLVPSHQENQHYLFGMFPSF